ncbi:MAG: phenylpyruvate tautomerase MIF-related protein [Acidiferrobacterales bacterium]
MPYLRIQTNRPVDDAEKKNLAQLASALVARELGKPESYVMIAFAPQQPMLFGGNDAPCAYLELKSIGLPAARVQALSQALCQLLDDALKIPPARVYIEFSDAKASLWGWDGATF